MSTTGTTSFCFLVNPASGGGAAPGAVVPVARLLRDAGAAVEVTYSPGPQAMQGLVASAVGRGDADVLEGVRLGHAGVAQGVVEEFARR